MFKMARENRNVCRYCANVFVSSKKKYYCIKKPIIKSRIKLDNPICENYAFNYNKKKG